MIFGNALVKAINGLNKTTTFVVYQIVFNLGGLVRLQTRKVSSSPKQPFFHNGWLNVAPLTEYNGQRNYHWKFTDDWPTDCSFASSDHYFNSLQLHYHSLKRTLHVSSKTWILCFPGKWYHEEWYNIISWNVLPNQIFLYKLLTPIRLHVLF